MKKRTDLKEFIKDNLTGIMASIPIFLGFFILWIWENKIKTHYDNEVSKSSDGLVVGITFLIWGVTFIIFIYRKELPQFITIRGMPAVIISYLGLFLCLFFGISLIFKSFGLF